MPEDSVSDAHEAVWTEVGLSGLSLAGGDPMEVFQAFFSSGNAGGGGPGFHMNFHHHQ